MSDKFLNREGTPFGSKVWEKIDAAVVGAAKSQLAGRRILHIDGPHGLGLKLLPCADHPVEAKPEVPGTAVFASSATPVAMIQSCFALAARDIAALEEMGSPLDLGSAACAAINCARQEDALVFNGSKALNAEGLLTAKGTQSVKLRSWEKIGSAAENVIEAIVKLDRAGFHGPYALAVETGLYNLLLRRHPQGDATELQHLQSFITEGVVKAPVMSEGGLLIASGKQYAEIVVGQDLYTAFVGPSGVNYSFAVSETMALRLFAPGALCVLR